MDQAAIRDAIDLLNRLIRELRQAKVSNSAAWRDWRKVNNELLAERFGYSQEEGMPKMNSLVSAFFHPTRHLIGLNYSPVAHNTLFQHPEGWTPALRLCRGLIFDWQGRLVAKPFEKFFNFGEHPETRQLPDEPFTATVKHDGHLGIVFNYRGRWLTTTRGSFKSRTVPVAQQMLDDYARANDWRQRADRSTTVLVEVIHPVTKVHLRYRQPRFILIGAYDNRALQDYAYPELRRLGRRLGLPVTDQWRGDSIADLQELMADLSVRNREGFVVRFQSGLRVKFKFASYINLMVESKLSHRYLLNRILSDSVEKMIGNLPEEIHQRAREMLDEITAVRNMTGTVKERRQYLYGLVPPAESTQYYRGLCRKVLKLFDGEAD